MVRFRPTTLNPAASRVVLTRIQKTEQHEYPKSDHWRSGGIIIRDYELTHLDLSAIPLEP